MPNMHHGGYEICVTQFTHPDIKSGQHTNGPATIWLRRTEHDSWVCTNTHALHKVRQAIDQNRLTDITGEQT